MALHQIVIETSKQPDDTYRAEVAEGPEFVRSARATDRTAKEAFRFLRSGICTAHDGRHEFEFIHATT